MKFYKVSIMGDMNVKAVAANSQYEAVGYYMHHELNNTGYMEEVVCEELPKDHKVEVSCVGFPVYKTVQEMYDEEGCSCPAIICGLWY
jgi:hypothetical protein